MLQSPMSSQLARIKNFKSFLNYQMKRTMMNPNYMSPMKETIKTAEKELKNSRYHQHWFCGGNRSIGIAVNLIRDSQIIAVPTDTIYGLTGLAQDPLTIQKLYAIKRRDQNKPLAICVGDISDVERWGETSHLPEGLLECLLPGPVTIVLKRTAELNPELNPDNPTIGIRIPDVDFLRNVINIIGEPLALTSANESNCPSTLHPNEFESLWPLLGGVFYDNSNKQVLMDKRRLGSTIVDLTTPGSYKVIRPGTASSQTNIKLVSFGLRREKEEKEKKVKVQEQMAA